MNKHIINKAKEKFIFEYEINDKVLIVYFYDYILKLTNFDYYYKNNFDCLNFQRISIINKLKLEYGYLRHYLETPIIVDINILSNILNYIEESLNSNK